MTLTLDYKARIEEGGAEGGAVDCVVKASASRGWNNAGSLLSYVRQRTFQSSSVEEEYYSRYRRGVSIKFKATGYVDTWNAYYAFTVLIDFVVIITAVLPLLIEIVATCEAPPLFPVPVLLGPSE